MMPLDSVEFNLLANQGKKIISAMLVYRDECIKEERLILAWRMNSRTSYALHAAHEERKGRRIRVSHCQEFGVGSPSVFVNEVYGVPVEADEKMWYGAVVAVHAVSRLSSEEENK